MKRKESPDAEDLFRIYRSYLEKPIKNSREFQDEGTITQMTLESIIDASEMGSQNIVIKEHLKEYIVENKANILAVPVLDEQKMMQFKFKRRRLAIKVGRLKAKRQRHEKMPFQQVGRKKIAYMKLEKTRLQNYIRMQPFLALFSKNEISKLESLPFTLYKPRLKRNGEFTVYYRNKVISQKKLLKLIQ